MRPATVLAPGWQQPYVNVFKLCDVDNKKEVEIFGDVKEHMDRIIGKKVFKIRGLIPAANFIRVPRLKSQTLGLTGRFLYIQVKVSPVKVFVIHLEVVTADLIVHRVSISSMYKAESLTRKSSGIQIPFPRSSHRWCIVAVDLATAVSRFTASPFHSLRAVQLCSWLTVRSMYTSDFKFSLTTLPRDMALSHALDTSVFEFLWLPGEPTDVQEADAMPMPRSMVDGSDSMSSSCCTTPGQAGALASRRHDGKSGSCPPPQSPSTKGPLIPPVFVNSEDAPNMSAATTALVNELAQNTVVKPAAVSMGLHASASDCVQVHAPGPVAVQKTPFRPELDTDAVTDQEAIADLHGGILEPDPLLTLQRINTFSGEQPRALVWPPHSNEVVFAAGAVVVAMLRDGTSQRFFLGHTAHVIAIAFDGEGAIMATAQEGKQAMVRVWGFRTGQCTAILNGHACGLSCLDVSQDGRALVAVGLDAGSKQMMVLWDISQIRYGGRPVVVVKQTTEYNIKAIRFSAYEADQLVTCGRDNVRTYRLKGGQLRGLTVRIAAPDKKVTVYAGGLAAALGPNVFTDIAFESREGIYGHEGALLYVSSASGALFQIDYSSRTLLCVFQLHSAAINALIVQKGFCVTGSDDKLLRVWPLDFSDYLMQAEHEAGVSSVGVSPDGLTVAVGTESCAIGVLDIASQQYATLLRSHLATVNAVAADPNRDEYCTASDDGTIRVWSLATHQQRLEFDAPGERALCVAYHPHHSELACGFANGRLRVFDLDVTTLIQEHQQHRAELVQLVFSPDGSRLYTGGADGGLCVYDVAQMYQPTKFLTSGSKDTKVCVAVSMDGRYVATATHDPYRAITSLLIFHGDSLDPYMRIETDTPNFSCLSFSPCGSEVWAVAAPNRLDRYELADGQLLQQVSGAHRLHIQALAADPQGRFVVTGGNDGLIKVWGVVSATHHPAGAVQQLKDTVPPHQAFGGHSSAVLGCVVQGQHVISVGDASSVYVWRINCSSRSDAAGLLDRHNTAQRSLQSSIPQTSLTSNNITGNQCVSIHASTANQQLDAAGPGNTTQQLVDQCGANTAAVTGSTQRCSALVGYTPSGMSQNAVWHPSSGLFAYAVDHVVVLEDLATHQQEQLSHFSHPVSALAVSDDGQYLAAAASAAGASGFAEVVVWHVATRSIHAVLQYHPVAVEAVMFSQDGRYLLSAGREPERTVVLWDLTLGPGHSNSQQVPYLAAVGRTRSAVTAIAWLTQNGPDMPVCFMTAGQEGILLWRLLPTVLEQVHVPLPVPTSVMLSSNETSISNSQADTSVVGVTALCCNVDGCIMAADTAGNVWELELPDDGSVSIRHMAQLPNHEVTRISTAGSGNVVALGTKGGLLATYSRSSSPSRVWSCWNELRVDGPITCMCFEPGMMECVVATRMSTIWYCHLGGQWRTSLVAGHSTPILQLAAPHRVSKPVPKSGNGRSQSPRKSSSPLKPRSGCSSPCKASGSEMSGSMPRAGIVVSAAQDAIRVWRAGQHVEPVTELQFSGSCTCVTVVEVPPIQGHRSSSRPQSPVNSVLTNTTDATNTLCIVAGFEDGSLRSFSIAGNTTPVMWQCSRHTSTVVCIKPHPSGGLLLSASTDGSIAVTNMHSSQLMTYMEHFIPGSVQQQLQFTDLPPAQIALLSGTDEVTQQLQSNPLCAVDVCSEDATVCAAAWRTHLVVFATPWNDSDVRILALYKCEHSAGALSDDVPAAVQFLPMSSKVMAYTSPLLLGRLLLFDYRLAAVIRTVCLPEMVRCLAVSSSGCTIAAGGTGGTACLIDTASGQVTQIACHRGPTTSLVFTADDKQLVACAGSAIQVWSLSDKNQAARPQQGFLL